MKSHQIIDYIAFARECTADDILGHERTQHIADGRAVAQAVLRAQGWAYLRIAAKFKCDHGSVMYNCKKVARLPELEKQAQDILTRIKQLETETTV